MTRWKSERDTTTPHAEKKGRLEAVVRRRWHFSVQRSQKTVSLPPKKKSVDTEAVWSLLPFFLIYLSPTYLVDSAE